MKFVAVCGMVHACIEDEEPKNRVHKVRAMNRIIICVFGGCTLFPDAPPKHSFLRASDVHRLGYVKDASTTEHVLHCFESYRVVGFLPARFVLKSELFDGTLNAILSKFARNPL